MSEQKIVKILNGEMESCCRLSVNFPKCVNINAISAQAADFNPIEQLKIPSLLFRL